MSTQINHRSKPRTPPPPPPLSSSSSSQSQPQPQPTQSSDHQILNSSMEFTTSLLDVQDTSTIWDDWGDLLNFNDWSSVQPDPISNVPLSLEPLIRDSEGFNINDDDDENSDPGRVRKRDPRLVCSNFLAGVVPCACPEVDEKMMELEEEEAGQGSKKRARIIRAPIGVVRRCQVPECGADIMELKGYHRRHRVCLSCATATTVVLDGENKRYCQQCGK